MSSHELLILLDYVCLFVMAICTVITCFHVESYMQKLASYACITITVCSMGFLFKAEATTLDALVMGQRLIYCFTTYAMFAMFMFIASYCNIRIPRTICWICIGLDLLVSLMALTIPYNQLFYKEVWAVDMGGYLVLEKEYAFGHTITLIIIAAYAIATLFVAIKYSIENIQKKRAYVWRLVIAVFIPYSAYIIPKIIDTDNDLQPLAFAIFLAIVVYMIYRNNLYDVRNILARYSVSAIQDAVIVLDSKDRYKGCNKTAEALFPELKSAKIDKDIRMSNIIFGDILAGKIFDYEKDDKIYEISVRDIDRDKYAPGHVIWFDDVTLQRNYMELLKKQKALLESEVVTLSDISYRDELTGLNNRRRYEEILEEVRTKKNTKDILVGLFDVNELKHTNDTIGHAAGDELIRGTGKILDDVFSDEGMTFRIGGDEFFVIIHRPKKSVREYRKELDDAMNDWKGEKVEKLSIAYGFALGNDYPDKNIDELSIIADKAMYDYKSMYYDMKNNEITSI